MAKTVLENKNQNKSIRINEKAIFKYTYKKGELTRISTVQFCCWHMEHFFTDFAISPESYAVYGAELNRDEMDTDKNNLDESRYLMMHVISDLHANRESAQPTTIHLNYCPGCGAEVEVIIRQIK